MAVCVPLLLITCLVAFGTATSSSTSSAPSSTPSSTSSAPSSTTSSTSTIWRDTAIRIHQLSSLVVGDFLYIDGGEIVSPDYGYAINTATVRIDLRESWTTTNVVAAYAIKPKVYPYARAPNFWTDGSNLYSTGGITFYYPDCLSACQDPLWRPGPDGGYIISATSKVGPGLPGQATPELAARLQPVPKVIWQIPLDSFDFKNNGRQQVWFRSPSAHQMPGRFHELQGAVGTSYGNRYYAMSGFSGRPYLPETSTNWLEGTPGLASWHTTGSHWKNISTEGFKPAGFIALGQGLPIPYGDKGSIIYIGGYAPNSAHRFNYSSRAVLANMAQINVFDIASETFLSQNATGDIPKARWAFCATVASEKNSDTYDIFIFGGFAGKKNYEVLQPSLQKVYVLSIPSFTWTETTAEKQQMRSSPTCQVLGNRQMIAIGGANPTDIALGETTDPWTNFMGLFDMTAWEWNFRYDSKAPPYKRNELLVRSTRKRKYPSTWDSKAVQDLFRHNITTYPPESSVPLGVKVGVPVAIVGLALIVAAFLFWLWRRRRSRAAQLPMPTKTKSQETSDSEEQTYVAEAPNEHGRHELSGEKRPLELGPFQPHELPGSGKLPEAEYWKRHSSAGSSGSATQVQEMEA